MQIYKVMMLPLAEEDIRNNTDYIAFEKKTPETALELETPLPNLSLCPNSMNWMKTESWRHE